VAIRVAAAHDENNGVDHNDRTDSGMECGDGARYLSEILRGARAYVR
jgi:hypothetical protein